MIWKNSFETETVLVMFNDFLDERFRTSKGCSLPDFQSIEDSTAEEEEKQHKFDFNGEENRESLESPPWRRDR